MQTRRVLADAAAGDGVLVVGERLLGPGVIVEDLLRRRLRQRAVELDVVLGRARRVGPDEDPRAAGHAVLDRVGRQQADRRGGASADHDHASGDEGRDRGARAVLAAAPHDDGAGDLLGNGLLELVSEAGEVGVDVSS